MRLGDFNFQEIPWLNYNTCHDNFSSLMEGFGHVQLNNIPSNCKGNIIDLVYSNVPEKMGHVNEYPCEFSTDHIVLQFNMYFTPLSLKEPDRYVYNYEKAEWDLFKSKIKDAPLSSLVDNAVDIDGAWNEWLAKIEQFMSATIPKVRFKSNKATPWFDSDQRHLHHVKMTSWRKARRTKKHQTLPNSNSYGINLRRSYQKSIIILLMI